jgi:hypothetical protein
MKFHLSNYDQGTITGTRADIIDVLFERQEDIPKWSPTVQDCRVCKDF